MSYYHDYISSLCPECDDWVITQICGMLDSKDEKIAAEKRNAEVERISGSAVLSQFLGYKEAMNWYFGKAKCTEAIEKFIAENENKTH